VQGNEDFSPAFRAYLASVDRELAALRGSPLQSGAAPANLPPAAVTTSVVAPTSGSTAGAEKAPPDSAPDSTSGTVGVAAAAPAAAPTVPASARPAVAGPPLPAAPQVAAAAPYPPAATPNPPPAAPHAAGAPAARGAGLRLLAAAGTRLPAPAPPASPQQQLLEQREACSVEQINGHSVGEETIFATALQPLRIAGWAADPQRPRAPEPPQIPQQAWLRFYDRGGGPGLLLDMPRNAERPDVARALGHPAYARAGFRITVEPGRLRPGEYTVAILQVFGADLAICSSIARLSLK
jgi:hypothetical protein